MATAQVEISSFKLNSYFPLSLLEYSTQKPISVCLTLVDIYSPQQEKNMLQIELDKFHSGVWNQDNLIISAHLQYGRLYPGCTQPGVCNEAKKKSTHSKAESN